MLKVSFPNVSLIISSSSDQRLSFVMSPGCTRPEDGALFSWIIIFYCELIFNGAAFPRSLVLSRFGGIPSE